MSATAASNNPTGPTILEIGCGTGLLSLQIAPYAKSLLAVDAASGMIDAMNSKLVDESTPRNVKTLAIMLEDPEDMRLPAAGAADEAEAEAGGSGVPASSFSGSSGKANSADHSPTQSSPRIKFDLILSHLVLHHIPDLTALLRTMHGCLKPGGYIALTDFEDFGPEARAFHPESKMDGVERHGVNAEWFRGLMSEAGFTDVDVSVAWRMDKEVERFLGEWGDRKPQGVELKVMSIPFLLCVGRKP